MRGILSENRIKFRTIADFQGVKARLEDVLLKTYHFTIDIETQEGVDGVFLMLQDEQQNAVNLLCLLDRALTQIEQDCETLSEDFFINVKGDLWDRLFNWINAVGNMYALLELLLVLEQLDEYDDLNTPKIQELILQSNQVLTGLMKGMSHYDTVFVADLLKWDFMNVIDQLKKNLLIETGGIQC